MSEKLYYDKSTGYLCERYPKDIEKTDSSPYIEVSEEDYENTFSCEYGKFWAVRDNVLQLVEDKETTATDDYKKFIEGNERAELQGYLDSTDYVITKLQEASLTKTNDEFNAMKAEYAEVLNKRAETRKRLDEME